ncbi:MAG: GNAT family N-acetyltransferase [Fibrobacteres bacterium]|nr:GNAT family N-acetyltransferase [Fibrobacterota bacterium]
MKRSARKALARSSQGSDPATPVDWSAAPDIDHGKLATGLYKYSGPSENRLQDRISHRELGFVIVSLRAPGGRWLPVKLWDFTSISFGVIHEAPAASWPAPAGMEDAATPADMPGIPPDAGPMDPAATGPESPAPLGIRPGDEVEIRIRLSPDREFETWCQVKNLIPIKEGTRIGLRRLDVNFPQVVDAERREAFRLPLSPTLSLKARVKHPFLFGHWSPLVVSDINRHMGLSFLSEDPSILLFEGMEIGIHFDLARHRDTPLSGRVTWVYATESNHVRFGVACVNIPWDLHNGICDYLLFSRQWTPGRLRQAGFLARQVKGRLRFRSVKTMEDYAEVLHLRREAYVGTGKKPKDTLPEDMASRLDGHSRILMAWHHDKLVGSITFAFPAHEEESLDSEVGFPGSKYPVTIPPKTSLIEVSRLCIDEEYRGTDLLQGLFQHGAKHFLLSDRYWLLTSAVSDLLPLYERIGFVKLGASYRHPGLNNLEHHLILAHRDAFLSGKGMNLFLWNFLFGDLVRHLLDGKILKIPGPVSFLIRAKLLFGPLSKRILEKRAAKAFRRHLQVLLRERERPKLPPAPILRSGGLETEDFLPETEAGAEAG